MIAELFYGQGSVQYTAVIELSTAHQQMELDN